MPSLYFSIYTFFIRLLNVQNSESFYSGFWDQHAELNKRLPASRSCLRKKHNSSNCVVRVAGETLNTAAHSVACERSCLIDSVVEDENRVWNYRIIFLSCFRLNCGSHCVQMLISKTFEVFCGCALCEANRCTSKTIRFDFQTHYFPHTLNGIFKVLFLSLAQRWH